MNWYKQPSITMRTRFLLLAMLCSFAGHAAIFDLKLVPPNTNWNDPINWDITGADSDGIPDADDDVIISAGNMVTIDGYNAAAKTILLKGQLFVLDGELIVSPLNAFVDAVTIASDSELEVALKGSIHIHTANNGIIMSDNTNLNIIGVMLIEYLAADGIQANDDTANVLIEGTATIENTAVGLASTGHTEVENGATLTIRSTTTGLHILASVGIGGQFINRGKIRIILNYQGKKVNNMKKSVIFWQNT